MLNPHLPRWAFPSVCLHIASFPWHSPFLDLHLFNFNVLGCSNTIWWIRSWSTLPHMMIYFLTVPSHFLNQYCLIIRDVLWHSPVSNYRKYSWTQSITCMMTSSNRNIFPLYWLFVQGIHQSLVNSPHKIQWSEALMFSLICAWTNSWVNTRDTSDLGCHHAHYDVTVMLSGDYTFKITTISPGGPMSFDLLMMWIQILSWG